MFLNQRALLVVRGNAIERYAKLAASLRTERLSHAKKLHQAVLDFYNETKSLTPDIENKINAAVLDNYLDGCSEFVKIKKDLGLVATDYKIYAEKTVHVRADLETFRETQRA
ncbi:MAG: hypothetical protein M1549_03360 [Candidatus Dependentiae bacterium]|nr:hypothetical protein [Candidatus Dependentiae bacterium]